MPQAQQQGGTQVGGSGGSGSSSLNPTQAYQQGQGAALKTLNISAPKAPGVKPFNSVGTQASATKPVLSPPKVNLAPPAPASPSAMVAGATQSMPKLGGFSMSHRPEEREAESQRADAYVKQPLTNEERHIANGIQPAFTYLETPSESDPYTIPRMF